ncbi:nucleotidyltransferase [Dyadobacter frigoris]|uniref:Nucleotidyltransferase n=1 Tax=Dyadobacter frigoris TaxID=2576211 RepID=A0A4V6BJI6_9BACT|nr:nucleotidyltransferase [Dyadobacter frigoris]
MEHDIRWIQRFQNFNKAFLKLETVVLDLEKNGLSELEKEGLIQRFEYTHELAWNVMKDFFELEGNTTIMGSGSATREAFKKGIIADGENWMDMINSRNSAHPIRFSQFSGN